MKQFTDNLIKVGITIEDFNPVFKNKEDIKFFTKSKRRVAHGLLDHLESRGDSKKEDLRWEYPFFNLREKKLSVTIAKNNIRMSKEDGCNPSYYEKELERCQKELKEYEKEWLPAIKSELK